MNTSNSGNDGVDTIERNKCLLCGREGVLLYRNLTDKLFGAPGIWDEFSCSYCKLLWLNPYAAPHSTEKLYKEYYTHEGLTNEFLLKKNPIFSSFPRNKKIKYAVLSSHFGYALSIPPLYRLLGFIFGLLPSFYRKVESSIGGFRGGKKGRLLDVGSGNGDYLLEMGYLGFDVYGIEIDAKAADISRKNGLSIVTGELTDSLYEEASFDAIYLNNVIEHLHNPEEVLASCYRYLKKGGELCIKTCSSESLAHTFYRESYRGLEIPRHFFVFSPGSLRLLGEKAGFSVKKQYTTFNGYIWSASSAIKDGDVNAAYAVGNKGVLFFQKMIVSITTFFAPQKGDDIFILFKK